MTECSVRTDWEDSRLVLRVGGSFDRAAAWALRDHIERDGASELVIDFSLVRDFSDLGVAVLAHGLQGSARRIAFRGLRQHQLRIFRYCGLRVDEAGEPVVAGTGVAPAESHAL